ncbi:TauD/TfdA family dioxygenase [Micromonospora sp. HUAS LYJ1]|uniref:TauD/TfdA dioxygenase family protein n=1 Tax=Micromonospora sp. HUAS LYJ1 TaxID=3061626 RepID=UPI00267148BC|nr:TauD/TfdA family dioxygenase [Micromonospora sp. HUAS LYJ1]WKU03959.1 TauD/TfdA family dioxygenase [Micromonospora sp. HUAS LYJ1]
MKRITGNVGVEIRGIDLATDLSADTVSAIRAAVVQHKVVFFRGQHGFDDAWQERFASRFGALAPSHATLSGSAASPAILELDYSTTQIRTDLWHTDASYQLRPPLGTILRAVKMPPYGGDTAWANTATAYQSMPEELRALADSLWVVHTNTGDNAPYALNGEDGAAIRAQRKEYLSREFFTKHPVVQLHPESGERTLLLGQFFHRVVGWSIAASRDVYRLLQSYVVTPENVVRWRWAEGDVAFWDNRATQHYAVRDYGSQGRTVHRITIAGDIPQSISGTRSESVGGDEFTVGIH